MKISIEELAEKVKSLQGRSEKQFVENLASMANQLAGALMLRGPYRLVLDANILMRLEAFVRSEWSEGVPATLLGFHLVKRLPFPMDLVIRPAVFYEFLKLRNVTSLKEHWNEIRRLKDLVEQSLDMTLFFDGVETFEDASECLGSIERDATKIAAILKTYQSRSWRFDFYREPGGFSGFPSKDSRFILVPPKFAAPDLYDPPDLEYFGGSVAPFLIEHIERHLCECRANDQAVIRHYGGNTDFILTRVLRLKSNGTLWGLADIDILASCNLQAQFDTQAHGRYSPASLPMTLDGNLNAALRRFSTMRVSSRMLGCGPGNAEESESSVEAFLRDGRRFEEGDKRVSNACDAIAGFMSDLQLLLVDKG